MPEIFARLPPSLMALVAEASHRDQQVRRTHQSCTWHAVLSFHLFASLRRVGVVYLTNALQVPQQILAIGAISQDISLPPLEYHLGPHVVSIEPVVPSDLLHNRKVGPLGAAWVGFGVNSS